MKVLGRLSSRLRLLPFLSPLLRFLQPGCLLHLSQSLPPASSSFGSLDGDLLLQPAFSTCRVLLPLLFALLVSFPEGRHG